MRAVTPTPSELLPLPPGLAPARALHRDGPRAILVLYRVGRDERKRLSWGAGETLDAAVRDAVGGHLWAGEDDGEILKVYRP